MATRHLFGHTVAGVLCGVTVFTAAIVLSGCLEELTQATTTPTRSTVSGPSCTGGRVECNGNCCPLDSATGRPESCCDRHNKCCPPGKPHHCAGSNQCYQFFTDAQRDCGTSYEICHG